jgi:hypothetical protein
MAGSMPAVFQIDYSTREYLFLTENVKQVIGFSAREIKERGLDFTIKSMDPLFLKNLNENIYPSIFRSLRNYKQSEHADHTFSFNFRIKNKTGVMQDLCQRSVYSTSEETGMPLFCRSTALNISEYKNDNRVLLWAEKPLSVGHRLKSEERIFIRLKKIPALQSKKSLCFSG